MIIGIDIKNCSNEELSQLEKAIQKEKNRRREKYKEYNDRLSALLTEISEADLKIVSVDEDGYAYDSMKLFIREEY